MPESFYCLVTDAGRALLKDAILNATSVDFATVKLGDGNGAYTAPAVTDVDLVNIVWTGVPFQVTTHKDNPNWIQVDVAVPPEDGGFTVRECGIYAGDGTLIAVGKYPATEKPVLAQGSNRNMYLRMIVAVENVAAVTLLLDPNLAPDIDEVLPLGAIVKASYDVEAWENGEAGEPTYMACDGRILLVAEYPDLAARLNSYSVTGFSGFSLLTSGMPFM